MKLLLYCTKQPPYLFNQNVYEFYDSKYITSTHKFHEKQDYILNGKIVAECDFEVEEIFYNYLTNPFYDFYGMQLHTKTLKESEILQRSKLDSNELHNYLLRTEDDYISPLEVGYVIHIKNLHIFDKPIDIRNYYNIAPRTMADCINQKALIKAPQNMCNAYDVYKNHYVLISIKPKWLCKILNSEKTIEVRKKVLKEMLE